MKCRDKATYWNNEVKVNHGVTCFYSALSIKNSPYSVSFRSKCIVILFLLLSDEKSHVGTQRQKDLI